MLFQTKNLYPPPKKWENIFKKSVYDTGRSLSEALIFASTNPQYDNRLFMELKFIYFEKATKIL